MKRIDICRKFIYEHKIDLFLIFYLFFFLYAPPIFIDLNIVFPLFLFSLYQLLKKHLIELKLVLNNINIRFFLLGILIYSVYYLLILIINILFFRTADLVNYAVVLYSYILFFPITITCCIYVICVCIKHEIRAVYLIKLFVYACLIQAGIALLSVISRDFKLFLLDTMYEHTGIEQLKHVWLNKRRFFGFSRNLFDLFGLSTGLICGIVILQLKCKLKNFIIILSFFILTLLNAKTGLIIILISCIIYLANKDNRKRFFGIFSKYKLPIIISLVAFVGVLCFTIPETLGWVINDFISLLPGTDAEGIGTLIFSKNFWTFPSSFFELLFGTGHNIFATAGFVHSDVGYVNEIWKTGVIGFVLLYGTIMYLFFVMTKSKRSYFKNLGILFFLSTFLFMIKGQVIGYNPATPLIFTVSLYVVLERNKDEKNISNDEYI